MSTAVVTPAAVAPLTIQDAEILVEAARTAAEAADVAVPSGATTARC